MAFADVDFQGFMELTRDPEYIRSLAIEADNLQGYLFPNTYRISWKAEPSDVIAMMVETFFDNVGDDFRERAAGGIG